MKVFVSSQNVPIGYTTPKFPLLYWPVGKDNGLYQVSLLYYRYDIWEYLVLWGLIMSGGLYACAGIIAVAALTTKRYRQTTFTRFYWLEAATILFVYCATGLFRGFVAMAVIGLILGAIYGAGELSMSTWIPFCWSVATILFDVCNAYSTSAVLL